MFCTTFTLYRCLQQMLQYTRDVYMMFYFAFTQLSDKIEKGRTYQICNVYDLNGIVYDFPSLRMRSFIELESRKHKTVIKDPSDHLFHFAKLLAADTAQNRAAQAGLPRDL